MTLYVSRTCIEMFNWMLLLFSQETSEERSDENERRSSQTRQVIEVRRIHLSIPSALNVRENGIEASVYLSIICSANNLEVKINFRENSGYFWRQKRNIFRYSFTKKHDRVLSKNYNYCLSIKLTWKHWTNLLIRGNMFPRNVWKDFPRKLISLKVGNLVIHPWILNRINRRFTWKHQLQCYHD